MQSNFRFFSNVCVGALPDVGGLAQFYGEVYSALREIHVGFVLNLTHDIGSICVVVSAY